MSDTNAVDALSAVRRGGDNETAAEKQLLRELVLSRMREGQVSREGLEDLVGGPSTVIDEKQVFTDLRERAGDRLP